MQLIYYAIKTRYTVNWKSYIFGNPHCKSILVLEVLIQY